MHWGLVRCLLGLPMEHFRLLGRRSSTYAIAPFELCAEKLHGRDVLLASTCVALHTASRCPAILPKDAQGDMCALGTAGPLQRHRESRAAGRAAAEQARRRAAAAHS